jgi:ADP-ribosyl-[dinitrogen reductase] hydrolase
MAVEQDRAVGALVGLAVGDALGATLEFSRRDSRPPVTDLVGGGPFGLKPGEWTDDTSMALCLADSLLHCRGFDAADLLQRFCAWRRDGVNSVTGECFDIGATTARALDRFERTGQIAWAHEDPRQAGNGSLMRLAPVAIFAAGDAAVAEDLADVQSRTTHPAPKAHEACRLFARLLVEAMNGADKDAVLAPRAWDGSPEIAAIARGDWRGKARDDIASSGYVVHTLEAALWCVAESAGFEEAVLTAANLGDDADTVAAVTGQLAGALWGLHGVRPRWVATLAWAPVLIERANALLREGARPEPAAAPST